MLRPFFALALATLLVAVNGQTESTERFGGGHKRLVSSKRLQRDVSLRRLMKHATALQTFAYNYPERNRAFGGAAHNDTNEYIYRTLKRLRGAYKISFDGFSEQSYTPGDFALTIDGASQESGLFQFSPNGDANSTLVKVDNLGCDASDYPAAVEGKIALISRGACEFGLKSAHAGAAGAVGAIIYNNVAGDTPLTGTLVAPPRPEGPYVATLGVTLATGEAWAEQLASGDEIVANLVVSGSSIDIKYTQNIHAQTVDGDQDNVVHLGAHTDSVPPGPGINDNGSGTCALLELAVQLSKYRVKNAVRFSWWSAEEVGLVGSEHYVANLTPEELAKIRLYLNYDMIASPNYKYGIYDGDGSSFGIEGPDGSAQIEKQIQDFFVAEGLNHTASEYSGRSDYGPFLAVGVASGGLFTGAEVLKTEEEAAMFGGEAGVALDANYHQEGDTLDNLNTEAFVVNTRSIADSIAFYARSLDTIPVRPASLSNGRTASTGVKFAPVVDEAGALWKGDVLLG